MKRGSIFGKIVMSHAATLIVAAAVSGAVWYFLVTEFLQANIMRELEQAANVVERLIDEDLSRGALYSKLLTENFRLKDALVRRDEEELVDEMIRELKTVSADFLSAADESGVAFAHVGREGDEYGADEERVPEPLFLSEVFQRTQRSKGGAIGIEVIYPNTVAAIAVSPIRDEKGGTKGFLRMGYRLDDEFATRIKRITGTELVLRYRGEILASTLSSGEPDFGDTEWKKLKRENVLHSKKLRDGKVELLAAFPRGDIVAVQRRGLLLIGAISLSAFLLAVCLSFPLARRVVRPLGVLMEGVKRVEKGDLGHSLPLGGNDEAGALAESFNRMTAALSAREEELGRSNRQLIETGKLAAVGELAAGVAHEIGNPVAAISGYIQLMKTEQVDAKVKHFLEEIDKELGYIDTTIRELLDFARPAELLEEDVDVNEAVDEAFRMLSHHPSMRKIRIERGETSDGLKVRGSRKEILQAVFNVALNGAQAMSEGGPMKVSVARGSDDGEISEGMVGIVVEDAGVGIRRADAERIFDPFFTTKRSGTGLGLSITYKIMERHGGRIEVRSEEGRGSRFMLLFPVSREA
ncbi:MAG: ATP-binding protein [bacterium]